MAEENKTEIPYEDKLKLIYQPNMDKFESFYFASLMKRGEHGKEGQEDGLYAALWGLREKVGLEGILGGLENEGLKSISSGNGLNAQFNFANIISETANIYSETVLNLKVKDILPYIGERLKGAKLIEEKAYKDKQLKDLVDKKAGKREQAYGVYLMNQLNNAVISKITPLVFIERADRENKGYEQTVLKLQDYLPREKSARAA